MFFPLFVSVLAFAAQAPAYNGSVQTSATAYTGEKFSRKFAVSATYSLANAPQGKARTEQKYYCEYNDDGQPENCADYCETRVKFELGSVTVALIDKDNGQFSAQTFPLTGKVTKNELKGSREYCDSLSLDGMQVYSKEVTANLQEPNGNWLQVNVDPYDSSTNPADHVVLSTVRSLGNEVYEVRPSQVAASTRAWWSYSHTSSWSTSGNARLELSKK